MFGKIIMDFSFFDKNLGKKCKFFPAKCHTIQYDLVLPDQIHYKYLQVNTDLLNDVLRLPPVVHHSDGKLVQVGSGNTSPDAQGTFE